jgi:hypothetical protein
MPEANAAGRHAPQSFRNFTKRPFPLMIPASGGDGSLAILYAMLLERDSVSQGQVPQDPDLIKYHSRAMPSNAVKGMRLSALQRPYHYV